MKKKETLEITALSGAKLTVDISDKACLKFGFRHGDKIIHPYGDEAVVMGVGSLYDDKALWYIPKGCKKAIHYGNKNLREAGARLKGEETYYLRYSHRASLGGRTEVLQQSLSTRTKEEARKKALKIWEKMKDIGSYSNPHLVYISIEPLFP